MLALTIMGIVAYPDIKAEAAWYNNAVDFVNSKGQQTAYYEDEAFWFGQAGTVPSTGTFYQTLGWQVGVYVNGNYYSVGYKTRDTSMQVDELDYGGLRYTLWKIPFNTIVKDLKAKYPSVNFTSLQDKTVNSRFYFDAIVRIYTNGAWTGDINNNGTTSWGYVYRSHYELAYGSYVPWGTTLIDQMRALFDISKDVSGSAKPQLPAPSTYSTLIAPNQPGWESFPRTHYHVDGSPDYWVNLRDKFTVYTEASIESSAYGTNVFPDYQYISLANGSSDDIRIYSYKGTDQWIPHAQWGNHFQNTETYLWNNMNDSNTAGYMMGHFRMRATRDGQTYRLSSAAVKAGQASAWTNTNQYLKTDGTSPTSNRDLSLTYASSDLLSIVQDNIYDTGSGLVVNSPYAYVYKEGSTNKGVKATMTKDPNYSNYSRTLNLAAHLGNQYGKIVVEIWARDNVGNEGIVKSGTINRASPDPVSTATTIMGYKYQDATTKWVNAVDEFYIKQTGYCLRYSPTGSGISISKGESNYQAFYKQTMYTSGYWTMPENNPGFTRGTPKYLSITSYTGTYYSTGNHYIKAAPSLNGQKFNVWGITELDNSGSLYYGSWVKDEKQLGVDAVGPRITYTKVGRTSIRVDVSDAESGVNKTEVWGNMINYYNTSDNSFVIDLGQSTDITITSTDNVGNKTDLKIGDIRTKIVADISTQVVEEGGRKKLKVTATANVQNPIPGKVITFNLEGTGDGVPYKDSSNKLIYSSTGSLSRVFMIDDIYNKSAGPTLSYYTDKNASAYVDIVNLDDLIKSYNLTIKSKYDFESSWVTDASKSEDFASGRKDYRIRLYRTSDKNFNPITKTLLKETIISSTKFDMHTYETGDYIIEVVMRDYNLNLSGMNSIPLHHIQPMINTVLDGEVTAVKDLAWEKAEYPIKFSDTGKFPLGSAFKFEDNPIKMGYGVNYNYKLPTGQDVIKVQVSYRFIGSDGTILEGSSNGLPFRRIDEDQGSHYAGQSSEVPIIDGVAYLKHFVPANAEFVVGWNKAPYKGDVLVEATVRVTNSSNYVSYNYIDLYTITTEQTVYDDLYIDKQR